MNEWFRFFLGSPERFLRTTIGLCIIAVLVKPSILVDAVNHVFIAIQPLIGPLITIAIVLYGIKLILRRGK